MQRNRKFSPEDATYEALTLTRTLEDSCISAGEDYDYKYSWPYIKYGKEQITYRNKFGQLHRLGGPAVQSRAIDYEFWYKNGIRHREGGPAYVHNGHIQKWYHEGKLHNLDGPAIIGRGRPKEYWIHGQRLSPKEYKKEIARRKQKNHYGW